MQEQRGWWSINFTIEPNECDLEHIEGYREGEIIVLEDEDK